MAKVRTQQPKTYADYVRAAMKSGKPAPTAADPNRREIYTIRGLAEALNYTYEHVRKVVRGEPVVSAELNAKICQELRLDADRMWEVAAREKIKRSYGTVTGLLAMPKDPEFANNFSHLTEAQKQRVIKMVAGLAEANRHEAALESREPQLAYGG